MTQRYELKRVPPEDVEYAEFNPRGEKEIEIEADPTFEQLKDSVWKYGVLVPIVVHRQDSGKPYRLVDGERRLRAALATKVARIPAHIATNETGLDDLVQAFHIHMLRKQWKAVAQAKALKRIMEKMKEQGRLTNSSDLLEELQTATGCTETRLKALRRAIRFPDSVLKSVDDGKLSWSHLIQIEESFIEAVKGKFPELLAEIGTKHARLILVRKAQQKTLTSTRALMENVLPVVTRADTDEEKLFAKGLLKEFLDELDMPAEHVLQQYEKKYPRSGRNWTELGKDVLEFAGCLAELLDHVDTKMLKSYPKLTKDVQERLQSLRAKLGTVLRRINRISV
ncbi:MAG: ParB N-terminal domain-containing protein [Sedimentisphaerales bacterium]|nr:ParB N-terminal domain-containing protein [Sedimentisphaerales bacterium]